MPRRPSPVLTDVEARLMNVLWTRERATVAQVTAALPRQHAVAYNTVQTMLRILERKGYVAHDTSSRAFVYRPVIGRPAARRRALGHLAKALFDGSLGVLVESALQDDRIDRGELERLKRLIADA